MGVLVGAQLVEWWIPTPEIYTSNTDLVKFYLLSNLCRNDENKEKRDWELPIKISKKSDSCVSSNSTGLQYKQSTERLFGQSIPANCDEVTKGRISVQYLHFDTSPKGFYEQFSENILSLPF